MNNYNYMCCCSLAGTKACESCTNNPNRTNSTGVDLYDTLSKYNRTISSYEKTEPRPTKPTVQYYCSLCDAIVDKFDKYCHNCGMPIDWSEYEKE